MNNTPAVVDALARSRPGIKRARCAAGESTVAKRVTLRADGTDSMIAIVARRFFRFFSCNGGGLPGGRGNLKSAGITGSGGGTVAGGGGGVVGSSCCGGGGVLACDACGSDSGSGGGDTVARSSNTAAKASASRLTGLVAPVGSNEVPLCEVDPGFGAVGSATGA